MLTRIKGVPKSASIVGIGLGTSTILSHTVYTPVLDLVNFNSVVDQPGVDYFSVILGYG